MPIKTYTEEFRRDAVALYENSPGVSINALATELGVNRNTLQIWVRKYGASWNEKYADSGRNAIFCARPRHISRKRRPGDPLPVR